ncbi:unnamed protein product [[Candida] boidinii]|uniref:PRA1 family protein n=1 Tax=Candida boidinii TaxID=5477 RepID=A0A9W6SVA9_CANBO|nr:hypothetical protein B5S27_g2053 [[Candida] boidinii]OWB66015.1 hypothetical protein B5S30_g1349 [[Candida] boidinii]OWB81737.1 hypothetical protein B5S33_g356 [[Candida] boidinii]GME67851.1 unnamed protein product [[Candida] boidinii]GME99022.1 unnamed protein product [[Candida] boidinii]
MNALSSLTQFQNIAENFNVERIRAEAGNLQAKFANIRPPQEFFDVRRISKPINFSEVQQRVSYNLGYFQANYISIVAILSIYALITNFLLLFVLLFTIGGIFGISKLNGEDLVLPFARLSTSQLYTGLMIIAVPLGFLASPISTMMWLIGASCVTVFSHASFMEKPIETVFEEQV